MDTEFIISKQNLDDITDAINEKTGNSETLTPSEMASAIRSIASESSEGSEHRITALDFSHWPEPGAHGGYIEETLEGEDSHIRYEVFIAQDETTITFTYPDRTTLVVTLSEEETGE